MKKLRVLMVTLCVAVFVRLLRYNLRRGRPRMGGP